MPTYSDSVNTMIEQFLTLYGVAAPNWDSVADLASQLGWSGLVNETTVDYLLKQGVSGKYIKEVVEAATRVNYGQVSALPRCA